MKVERIYKPKFENVSLDEWLESPKRRIKKIPVNIPKKRDSLLRFSGLYIDFSRWLTWEAQTPKIENESATGLRYASKMYAAFLKLAEHPEQDLTFKIFDLPEVTWNGKGMLEAGRAHPEQWLDAYFLAMVTRDSESMNSLASFPVEVMKQSATKAGPVSYKLVEVFQAYHHRQENYPSLLNECMKMAVEQGNEWALGIAMGCLETFAALTTDIGFDFNETLAKNVQLQEKYWMNASEPDTVPVESFLPLQLLGMACMWHDMGNEVTVESDSLPRFLINGTYFK
ncbi:immunity 49 family protein [Pseudoalteromonas undina]|uniref:immunity 49 family protein n=1 Tax=Pseudoalteromonas undina TaxID=43660 RepID=UPI001866CF55|nr:immunity 49 family protein [Pseudoalteromonas undina]